MDYLKIKNDLLKSPFHELAIVAIVLWLVYFYIKLADFIHGIGIAIGTFLAK